MDSSWVAAIASVVQTAVVLTAAFVALRQLRESANARTTSGLLEVFKMLHSPEATSDRRIMFDPKSPSADRIRATRRSLELLEWISLLARRNLLPKEVLLDMYSDMYISVWQRARPLVVDVRKASENYAEHVEHIVGESLRFREQRQYRGEGPLEESFMSREAIEANTLEVPPAASESTTHNAEPSNAADGNLQE